MCVLVEASLPPPTPACRVNLYSPRLNVFILSQGLKLFFPRRRYLIVNGDNEVMASAHSAEQDVRISPRQKHFFSTPINIHHFPLKVCFFYYYYFKNINIWCIWVACSLNGSMSSGWLRLPLQRIIKGVREIKRRGTQARAHVEPAGVVSYIYTRHLWKSIAPQTCSTLNRHHNLHGFPPSHLVHSSHDRFNKQPIKV